MRILRHDNYFILDFPYKPWIIDAVKKELPNRFFDFVNKKWKVPVSDILILKEFARKHKFSWELEESPDHVPDVIAVDMPDLKIEIPLKLKLFPYQRTGVQYALEKKRLIIGDKMGLGKALEKGSCVLTPDGWRKIESCIPGTRVYAPNGDMAEVTGFYPQGVKDIYEITFSDKTKIRCCDEHLWEVYTPNSKFQKGKNRVMTTRHMIDSGLKQKNGNRKYYLPLVSGYFFEYQKFIIHPYLLGLLIGDGCLRTKTKFTTADKQLVEFVQKLLPDGMYLRHAKGYDYTIQQSTRANTTSKFEQELKILGLKVTSADKYIPIKYLLCERRQRIELLQGLMDSDGWISKDGTIIQYTTVSKAMCDDFCELVQSLGGIAKVSTKQPKKKGVAYGRLAYTISINVPADICPFRLERKRILYKERTKYLPSRSIESIEKVGRNECYCIKVDHPSSLFITDNYTVTHNTAQAIAAITGAQAFPCLVICPATLKTNWEREWHMWTGRRAKILDDATARHMDRFVDAGVIDVFICNYESLKKYFVEEIHKNEEGKWTLRNVKFKKKIELFKSVILDESHRCKEFKTQATKFAKGICSGKEYVLALTGTPVVNKPKDLVPQLGIIDRLGDFGGYKNFMDRYCAGQNEASHLKELNWKLLNSCFYSRNKEDVLKDLPAKMRQVVYCDMDEIAWMEYNKALNDLEGYLKQYREATDEQIAKSMKGKVMVEIGILKDIAARGKLAGGVREFIEETTRENKEKLVLFAHQHKVFDQLQSWFPAAGTITGRDTFEQRQQAIDAFQNNPACKLILCSIQAAGVGITLTASSRVAFVELGWHSAIHDQAEDRCHRIGQKDSVQCTYFLAKNTIDEWVYALIEKKRQMVADITGGNMDAVEKSVIEDIIELFNKKELAA